MVARYTAVIQTLIGSEHRVPLRKERECKSLNSGGVLAIFDENLLDEGALGSNVLYFCPQHFEESLEVVWRDVRLQINFNIGCVGFG